MNEKKFNTAGPSVTADHYTIDPLVRIDQAEIESLIADKRYFILHAPRQTGKTTSLLALMHFLNTQGKYRAAYANIEGAQAARNNVAEGMAAVTQAIARQIAYYLGDTGIEPWLRQHADTAPTERLSALLSHWSQADPAHPAVLLLDEVDALIGDTLVSLLRQIRAGYAQRPEAFPQTVIMCGVRDVKDYRIHTSAGEIITGGSAFNIKAKSLRLGNFDRAETIALWQQHQTTTGQTFDPAIWDELWLDTEGQPWLVNALAYECTWEDREARDRSVPITLERYKAARERLIYSRATHLDQLTDKLQEDRVKRVVVALLQGESALDEVPGDDQRYVEDLGLIATRPQLRIANRIYREVIPRDLTWTTQTRITHDQPWYVTAEHRLDMPKLLSAFQQFFREHSDAWIEGFSYKEAGPQLLMQAFLQRIVNGGGRIGREYALGRKRTDLFLEWPIDEAQGYNGPVQRVVIELKLVRKGTPDAILAESLQQTADYAERVGADEAYLLIFDRRETVGWDERCWQRTEAHNARAIPVWGM